MTKMNYLFERQGLETKPAEYEQAKQSRREKNIAAAREVLTRNAIEYKEFENFLFSVSKEDGAKIHYHPPTGEWHDPQADKRGYGIRNLVRYIKGEVL